MWHGVSVDFVAAVTPFGHVFVHAGDESGVVGAFDQVDKFVHEDVLQAFRRLLGQFEPLRARHAFQGFAEAACNARLNNQTRCRPGAA
jgi:hypothetical protein